MPDEPPWQPTLARTFRKDDGTALTLGDLEALFRERPVRCIKTMQCLMDSPSGGLCSNGLWEGVALRDVIARLGRLKDVRRVYYTGFFETRGTASPVRCRSARCWRRPPATRPSSSPCGSTGTPSLPVRPKDQWTSVGTGPRLC